VAALNHRHQRFLFKPITDVIIAGFASYNLSSHYHVTESYHCADACLRKVRGHYTLFLHS